MAKQEKCDKHHMVSIDLGNKHITPETIVEALKLFFKIPLRHCKVCGGLVPELKFLVSDKEEYTYSFTCYAKHKMILRDDGDDMVLEESEKISLGTNYKKFLKFLQACEAKKKLGEAK